MEQYYERDGIVIYNCDCRQVVEFMDARVVDSIVTDPPYGLEFMGKEWDHGVPGEHFWDLLKVVCKPGAMMLAFGGTRKFHRLACAIEDAGWEIRDCINWLYGSGVPKSLDVSKAIDKAAGAEREVVGRRTDGRYAYEFNGTANRPTGGAAGSDDAERIGGFVSDKAAITAPSTDAAKEWQGWGTALKPAWEPIIVAMNPLDGTFAQNALKHGVAGLNIDGCRIGDFVNTTPPGTDRYNQANYEQGYRPNAYQSNGRDGEASADKRYTKEGGTNFSAKPGQRGGDVKGRFPANLIHDGSDGVLVGFPQQASGANPTRRGSPKFRNAYGEFEGQGECVAVRGAESGSAARFFYCAKASKKDRGEGNTHPTVKPHELMKYLLQLVSTPTGGIVLDPFMGSGSTLVAAKVLGRKAIGIEISKEYCDIAISRLNGNVTD